MYVDGIRHKNRILEIKSEKHFFLKLLSQFLHKFSVNCLSETKKTRQKQKAMLRFRKNATDKENRAKSKSNAEIKNNARNKEDKAKAKAMLRSATKLE